MSLQRLPAALALLLTTSLLAPPAMAQTLRRVRVDDPAPDRTADELRREGYDVLAVGPGSLEVVVSPDELRRLRLAGHAPLVLEVGRPFADIQRERQAAGGPDGIPAGYPTLAEVLAHMNAVAAAHPSICTVVDLTATYGTPPTHEGRHQFAVKLSDNVGADEDEPSFLMVFDHHARELVTPTIGLDHLDRLSGGYGADPTITALLDAYEIWIAPVWNPDGYEYAFNVDNLWRKNRRDNGNGNFGVDLNRNYPFGWGPSTNCSGSSSTGSQTYYGPSAASEPETQTMLAFAADRRFTKLHDYHSYSEEVRYGYGCLSHPWLSFLASEAAALSLAGGYGGQTASSCCTGGDIHHHAATYGTHAFLWETHTQFQPDFASAQAEALKVWPGALEMLQRAIPISGRVTDACSGAPVEALVRLVGEPFSNGETFGSGGPFGRYHVFPPPSGTPYPVEFSAPGYLTQVHPVTVASSASATVLDVALVPTAPSAQTYCTAKTNSQGCLPAIAFAGTPSATSGAPFTVSAAGVLNNKNGLLFYGFAEKIVPFQGGLRCVRAPLRRTPLQDSGGQPPPEDCSGTFAYDFNARIASGVDGALTPGRMVYAQYWYRDPSSASTTGLTDAVRFPICP